MDRTGHRSVVMVRLYTCRADAFADEGTQVFLGHGVARVLRPRSPIGV